MSGTRGAPHTHGPDHSRNTSAPRCVAGIAEGGSSSESQCSVLPRRAVETPSKIRHNDDNHRGRTVRPARGDSESDAGRAITGTRRFMAHLLLIDDDAVLVPQQVRQAFPAPAYRVVVAQNGNHGVELVRRAPPDVVLLDLHLPDRPGLEVYRSIRAIDARIPVIFIATAKTADAAIETVKHGAFDYLHKPLDLAQLQRVVTD